MDLLIVDDEEPVLNVVNRYARLFDLETNLFMCGTKAVDWLNSIEPCKFPLGYLIDMKLTNNTKLLEELESSRTIFECVHNKKPEYLKNFVFYTWHYTFHDEEICRLTGAKVIIKPGIDEICQFYRELAEQKKTYVAEAQ